MNVLLYDGRLSSFHPSFVDLRQEDRDIRQAMGFVSDVRWILIRMCD